jgi:hypothetical protein
MRFLHLLVEAKAIRPSNINRGRGVDCVHHSVIAPDAPDIPSRVLQELPRIPRQIAVRRHAFAHKGFWPVCYTRWDVFWLLLTLLTADRLVPKDHAPMPPPPRPLSNTTPLQAEYLALQVGLHSDKGRRHPPRRSRSSPPRPPRPRTSFATTDSNPSSPTVRNVWQ